MRGVLVALLLMPLGLAGPAAGGDGCGRFGWPLTREIELFSDGYMPAVEASSWLPREGAFTLILAPVSSAFYLVTPERGRDDGFGGIVTLQWIAAGRYQVTLTDDAWIDVVQDERAELLPDLGMLLGELCIERDAEGRVLFLEQPADPRHAPFDGVLSERFVDDIGLPVDHVGPEIRAMILAPDFDIKDEADRNLAALGPGFHRDLLARETGDPVFACLRHRRRHERHGCKHYDDEQSQHQVPHNSLPKASRARAVSRPQRFRAKVPSCPMVSYPAT